LHGSKIIISLNKSSTYLSFSLTKKKQKVKTIRQTPSAPQKHTKMAVRTELTKGSRPLSADERLTQNNIK